MADVDPFGLQCCEHQVIVLVVGWLVMVKNVFLRLGCTT